MGLRREDILLISTQDDERTFKKFFNLYYPGLFRFALYMVKSDLLAEEIVSDIFVKIWKNRCHLPAIQRMDYYLIRSVKNQALNYLRQNSIPFEQIEKVPESSLMSTLDPEKVLLHGELKLKVRKAVEQLPTRCRLVFELARDSGLKQEEIASLLNISKKTVKNQMTVALRKIRETLSAYIDIQSILDRSKILLFISLLPSFL